MNRSLLLLLCACFVSAGYSQTAPNFSLKGKSQHDDKVSISKGPFVLQNDSSIARVMEYLRRKPSNENNMPNALAVPGAPDVYVGHNGKGHDIYRSQIDNMPVLKPDSTFASYMRTRRWTGVHMKDTAAERERMSKDGRPRK